MILALTILCGVAAAYQLTALAATIRHFFFPRPAPPAAQLPFVSILKPMRGADPHLYEALRSHATQDYPAFEMLCGVRSPDDPAVAVVEKLRRDFPRVPVRLIVAHTDAPNNKVGTLIDLARESSAPLLVVNDADIVAPEGWLREVCGALNHPQTGVVTCIYRARGSAFPARFEALGVSTDFAPSALVAPFVGISEFALGSTLAFRRADLDAIGGFESIAPYIADDYQLGKKIHALGRRNVMARAVVETHLGARAWRHAWAHQTRWARTIRLSRGAYAGLFVTHASLWALLAACCGAWRLGLSLLLIRLITAITAGWFGLRSPDTLRLFFLIPVRDLWGAAVWAAGLFGHEVHWGGRLLRLDSKGRIV